MAGVLPRVSIVTVTLNGREHIEGAIRSVLSQDYPSVEHLIVDGGSTDGTLEVLRAYEDRLASWTTGPDGGIADAFNKGLAAATGDYVLFLNSDDWLADPEALSRAMRVATGTPPPDIIFGDCDIVDRDTGRLLRRLDHGWSPTAFRFGRMINHPALFAHRSYFRKYGAFDVSFRIAMDFEFLLRGALQSTVVHVPSVITNMRSGGLSMRNREGAVAEIIRALKKNRVIAHPWQEWFLRVYFGARGALRPLRQAAEELGRRLRAPAGRDV
ncbi:MAG TPA: glycosyltransferase family 2 protein [Burkholderiales bacterium]|nr:glycosyltransferase family 2 protein [Burkholderiales bacterium]